MATRVGGPIQFKDKLFFFGAQEWVNYLAGADEQRHRADRGDARRRLQRAAPAEPVLQHGADHQRSADRPAVPGQHHSGEPAVAQRRRAAERVSAADAGLQLGGAANAIVTSDNPQDQRKDNIRFDYRLNAKNNFTYRYGKYNWTAVDAFRGSFPYARTDWDRPNTTQTASWTSTITSTLINDLTYTNSLDEVFINVFRGTDLFQRSKYGINYPYIFPENKEIEDKIPDDHDRQLHRDRRRPVSVLFAWSDPDPDRHDDVGQGTSHVQGRRRVRVLG